MTPLSPRFRRLCLFNIPKNAHNEAYYNDLTYTTYYTTISFSWVGFCWWGPGANIADGSSLIIHWSSGSYKRSTNWANHINYNFGGDPYWWGSGAMAPWTTLNPALSFSNPLWDTGREFLPPAAVTAITLFAHLQVTPIVFLDLPPSLSLSLILDSTNPSHHRSSPSGLPTGLQPDCLRGTFYCSTVLLLFSNYLLSVHACVGLNRFL